MKKNYLIIVILIIVILILIVLNINIYDIKINSINNLKNSKFNIGKINQNDMNNVWCGSFELAWNELIDSLNVDKIEFKDNSNMELLDSLNRRKFNKNMISDSDYKLLVKQNSPEIIEDLKYYGITDAQFRLVKNCQKSNGLVVFSSINKEFEFIEKFDILTSSGTFNNDISGVTYFGIDDDSNSILYNNIEVLYYNDNLEKKYAVKLKTKGSDDIILYTLDKSAYNSSFEEIYDEIIELEKSYDGSKKFEDVDIFKMPSININVILNYDSLCGKEIKNTNGSYLSLVNQYISLDMNNHGVKLDSNAIVYTDELAGYPTTTRKFRFNIPFVMFLKEAEKDEPYFAVKIMDSTFLDIKK